MKKGVESGEIYQMEATLQRLEAESKDTSRCLGKISSTLDKLCEALYKFSGVNEKQARLEAEVETLKRDGEDFRAFMNHTNCSAHETEIKYLKEGVGDNKNTDKTQNKNAFLLAVTALTSILTGAVTWIFTK